jgi:signal transduction histidine kinase
MFNPDKVEELFNSFSQIAHITNTKYGYAKKLTQVLEVILDYLGAEQGSIMTKEGKNLIVRASRKHSLIGHKQRTDDKSIASWVARAKVPVFIPNISNDERFPTRDNSYYKTNALLSVPILNAGRLVGILNVTDKHDNEGLMEADIKYLMEFSGLLLSIIAQQDLTEKISKQKNTLAQKNKELKHQEKMREELSKMLVHDIKGPLSEVVANLDILSYSIKDDQKDFLESAQIGCDQALQMIANIGTVSKAEDGKLKLIKEDIEPLSLIKESISRLTGIAKIRNIDFKLIEPKNELPIINVDTLIISRVLQNLLTNALSYSSRDSTVEIGCEYDNKKEVKIFVQDQGEGIPENKQKMIFEKYSRISKKQDALVGSGLGLYFCKLAVEQHSGTINLASSPGKGSCFFFTLPI